MNIFKSKIGLMVFLSFAATQVRADIITPTSATATTELFAPTRLIDGSGLDGNGSLFDQRHDNNVFNMWLSGFDSTAEQQELEFELDGTFDLNAAIVWQHNGLDGGGNPTSDRDVDELEILVSPDLESPFVSLGDFALNISEDPLDASGEPAQFLILTGANGVRRVKFNIISAIGGPQQDFVGLSEVRFDGALVGAVPAKTWIVDSQGDWFNDFNWSPAAPNGNTESAVFGGAITSPRTVSTDQQVAVKAITFENTQSYVIAGAGAVNLDSDSGNASLTVSGGPIGGAHQFQVVVNILDDTDADIGDGSSLEFVNRLNLNGNLLTKTGDGTLTISNTLNTGGGMVDCQQGICAGSGTIAGDLINSGANVAPGNSPGILTVAGSFTQGADGTLAIEIGGTMPGDEHDQLIVNDMADLAGALSVTLIDDFDPSPGSTFEVLTGTNITDNGISLSGPDAALFSMTVGPTSVLLEVIGGIACDFDGSGVCDIADLDELLYIGLSSGEAKYDLDGSGTVDLGDRDAFLIELDTVAGDFDLNGQVSAIDLNILGGNWTRDDVTSYGQGDANGDGAVNAADLNALGGNWQFGVNAASAVPEPSMLPMSLLGFFGLRIFVRKSHSI